MPATTRDLLRLLDKLEGPLRDEFLAAVENITSRARIADLMAAIQAGDAERALAAAGVRTGSWTQVTESVRGAYVEAGIFTLAADVPKRLGLDFDITNPRAERWLRERSSRLVTLINNEQREAIRHVLQAGMAAGRNPRSVALDIVGRISPRTKRRSGGIIGLNGPQAEAVTHMRGSLSSPLGVGIDRIDANGKPVKSFWIGNDGKLKSSFARRDRRFDSIVRRAIADGKPLDQATINRLTGRYSDRLLKLRGDTIGRTEALASLNEASDEALRQVIGEGLAPPDAVVRIWDATGDSRTRPDHLAADGQERGVDQPFNVGGYQMMHPGDGPASQVINCRCLVRHKIDFIAVEQAA